MKSQDLIIKNNKMIILLFSFVFLSNIKVSFSQGGVSINTSGSQAAPSAILDISSTDAGVLIPRMDYNNKPVTPDIGLLIYVTSNGPAGDNKFYYFDGVSWVVLGGSSGTPSGIISMWSGTINNIPQGWALCDGNNGTPNLLDRFILGVADIAENPGAIGGHDSIQLTVNQLPAHNHTASANSAGEHSHTYNGYATTSSACCNVRLTNSSGQTGSTNSAGEHTHTITINNSGLGYPIGIYPKYYKLAYIMKL